ncbi:NACHT domain-containing protein, partial [Azospirillum endophyticum]
KDAVSSEVIVFIDDVLVGCQSDVAAVCTSRPQGYSGQLSALDATTIELTHLSPQQALKCALPVLQIERSDEDSKSYYEILSEAILSPSIQEIMTSPLQAHIMAVVVRDGGKPPERRWALFNNFYHVIKKREANRKLPDKNLSRLLLQGDRLLKDLHNRLGFELHFQAETRKGARTSLNRTELRKIVYETVSNLQDNDVDSTVNTLMEATTERLVLVSTPETGQEVRFDIRPLQEFFAAEYIYESVPADKLSQRLKIIAGDSHWSEVMHFLMSALIENGRQTELSVAIGILLDLNENGDTGGMRSLSRRLALGGIIYSRLLQEGVLEQDKKIRHSFRACIDALLSSVDAVDFLCRVDRDHSKHWLIDVLADSLEEKTEPENIGASSVLAFIMPDNHKRLPEARKYISQSSFPYFSCVCEIIASNISDDQEIYGGKGSEYVKSPRWIVDIIIDRLISQEWTNISPKGLRHCLKILRNNKETVWEYCYKFLSDKETASFVTELLCVSDEWDDAQRELITEDRIGNAVEVKYYKTTGSHNYENASDHQIHSLKTMGGFLKVIALVFEFAKERNLNKYNELKAHCQNISEFVRSFPDYLAHLIPVRDSGDLISPDLPEFHYYLESRTYGARGEFSFLDLSSMTNNDMDIIISEYTGLTMHALTSEHDRKILGPVFQEYISSEAGLNTFAEVLDKDPLFLFSYSFYWSIIFSLPFSIGERLRRLAVGHCPCTFPHEAFGAITSTFQLRLPEEAEILPFILLMSSQSAENKHYIVSGTNEKQGKRQSLAQIIAEFAPNANDLLRISYDEKYSVSARSAASAMYLAHPGSDKENQYIIMGNLSSFYQLSPGHWFLSAVADVLRDFVNADDQTCIDTFGTLIQMSKSDYNSRFLMDRRIAKWRELSRAPVLKHGNMEIWN